jgi:hypothetical protein
MNPLQMIAVIPFPAENILPVQETASRSEKKEKGPYSF